MLIGNGRLIDKIPMSFLGRDGLNNLQPAIAVGSTWSENFGPLAALPDGYYTPQGWMLPRTAGRLAAKYQGAGVSTGASGSAVGGKNTSGTAGIVFDATGTGGLISSATGIAGFTLGAEGNIFASKSTSGTATVSLTSTGALRALGHMGGMAPVTFAASWTPYAVGWLGGSTASGGVLSEASILAAMNANPPRVNIAKVNGVDVAGTGAPGNEWGPV